MRARRAIHAAAENLAEEHTMITLMAGSGRFGRVVDAALGARA